MVSFLYKSHKALTLGVCFVVLPVYYHRVGRHFKYWGFVRQIIHEAEIAQLILQLRNFFFPEMYHSFMKIPYSKYQLMIKYLSLIFIIFVIMGVLDGFTKQIVLLTTTVFYFGINITYFIFWSSLYLQCIYGGSHRT